MQVQVTGHHVVITPGLKNYIAGKLDKLAEFYPKLATVAVIITVEKYRHTSEIHFHADGVEMSAKKTTKDMYASIEEAVAALIQQAGKRKDKLRTSGALRRTAAREKKIRGRSELAAAKAEPAPAKVRVVKVRSGGAKSLSIDEAVAALEDSDKPFLLFRDSVSGAVQLLFRREDGHFGLSEA